MGESINVYNNTFIYYLCIYVSTYVTEIIFKHKCIHINGSLQLTQGNRNRMLKGEMGFMNNIFII